MLLVQTISILPCREYVYPVGICLKCHHKGEWLKNYSSRLRIHVCIAKQSHHCWLIVRSIEQKKIFQGNAFQNITCKMLASLIPAWICRKYDGQAFPLCCNWPVIRSTLELVYIFYHLSFEEHVSVQLLTGIVHYPVNVPWLSIVMSDGRLSWKGCRPGLQKLTCVLETVIK